ncbi:hypothetical protein Pint_29327 [Pistacia integerrima]|uniref:Uncharacterized protein n=1 Tax=Pistacia integerrima TaxID=434235 RepID=A0ACC0X0D4_9ROSI|nr:hypothetical protein Pint_29327 [Pistacia integerrima]
MKRALANCIYALCNGVILTLIWLSMLATDLVRRIIAMLSQDFIFDGCTILVHGFSRVVLEVLKTAAQNKKLFRVFCTGFVLIFSELLVMCID